MDRKQDWMKDLIVYQIYPRSFYDSNGDGIGDLAGILQKVDYLQELGVNAVWLSPVYRSPNDDNGYDIADYQEIMEEFGTMEDWDRLRSALHTRGIRIIMDLVVNHSSDEHAWFRESRTSRDSAKSEYYIWRDPVNGKEPNNWASVFGGSAWEYAPERGQYYLHLFSKKQPDLNWASEELREEIYRMMSWWVDKGVDGFRVDAISYLDKPEDYPDSPLPAGPDGFSSPMELLSGRPKTHGYIREMNRRVFTPGQAVTVGEVSAPTVEELVNYVAASREEFDMAIPFVPPVVEIATWSPGKLKREIQDVYLALKDSGWWARFFSDHDKPRQVSLYGDNGEFWEVSAKMLAMLLHTLPGTPFVYQGEEIGMTDVRFASIDQYNDLDAKNLYRSMLLEGATEEEALRRAQRESRDNARTPMQWDAGKNAGFSQGKPWLPVNPNYERVNARAQREDSHSIFQCYRRLIALRKEHPALSRGDFTLVETQEDTLLVYSRTFEQEKLLAVHNFSREPVKLPTGLLPEALEVLLSGYDREGGYQGSDLRPYESVLFRLSK